MEQFHEYTMDIPDNTDAVIPGNESRDVAMCQSQLELLTYPYHTEHNLHLLQHLNTSDLLLQRLLNVSTGHQVEYPPLQEPEVEPNFPWVHVMLPLICSLGISGNIMNLVVLTKKRISNPLRRLEKAASVGLTALALSDLLFCITVFPYTFLDDQSTTVARASLPILYYRVYGISAINVFLMSSTWLVVELALERYIVLYYPLRAKCVLGLRRTKIVIISIFLVSVLATLPYFLNLEVSECRSLEGDELYEIRSKWEVESVRARMLSVYQRRVWPVIAVFIPLTLLLFCNVRLVQGLRQVPTSRRKLRCPSKHAKETHYRITLTLIIIIFMAIALVMPAEILKLVNPYKLWGLPGYIAASIANVLQTVNFAFNFILYCTLDVHFRRICKNLVIGYCARSKNMAPDSDVVVLHVKNTSYPANVNHACRLSVRQDGKFSKEKLYS